MCMYIYIYTHTLLWNWLLKLHKIKYNFYLYTNEFFKHSFCKLLYKNEGGKINKPKHFDPAIKHYLYLYLKNDSVVILLKHFIPVIKHISIVITIVIW